MGKREAGCTGLLGRPTVFDVGIGVLYFFTSHMVIRALYYVGIDRTPWAVSYTHLDTMRISLTDDPVVEVRACWTLLGALDLRRRSPELISCPTCGRCQVNLIGLAQEVEQRLATVDKPVKVAVMGCVVNGPGEAADADIGVACGAGAGVVFSHGKIVRKVQESEIVSALMEELENL